MATQNYSNHVQYVPVFHYGLLPVVALTFIGSLVNLYKSLNDHERLYSASLIAVLAFCAIMMSLFCRVFALKAQDRAIRAEENLRHFAMTGRLLDARLNVRQVVGLRFAGDSEFVVLAKRAADENLSEAEIKKAVKGWRADLYRV